MSGLGINFILAFKAVFLRSLRIENADGLIAGVRKWVLELNRKAEMVDVF